MPGVKRSKSVLGHKLTVEIERTGDAEITVRRYIDGELLDTGWGEGDSSPAAEARSQLWAFAGMFRAGMFRQSWRTAPNAQWPVPRGWKWEESVRHGAS